jgi:LmbE family N-acetylglucosaminyl deacetylase
MGRHKSTKSTGTSAASAKQIQFARRKNAEGTAGIISSKWENAFTDFSAGNERIGFVVPHDDDAVIMGGLLMQKAVADGIPVDVVITTDGRNGYNDPKMRSKIVAKRKKETEDSLRGLGISQKNIIWLGYPDTDLRTHGGRRKALRGSPHPLAGHSGLQNSFVDLLKRGKYTRLFVANGSDLHPDHKQVYEDLIISVFHAAGGLWGELHGGPIPMPFLYIGAIYCDFPPDQIPNLRVIAPPNALDRKAKAVEAYGSQEQIGSIKEKIYSGGPIENFYEWKFEPYDPRSYDEYFRFK